RGRRESTAHSGERATFLCGSRDPMEKRQDVDVGGRGFDERSMLYGRREYLLSRVPKGCTKSGGDLLPFLAKRRREFRIANRVSEFRGGGERSDAEGIQDPVRFADDGGLRRTPIAEDVYVVAIPQSMRTGLPGRT